MAVTLSGASTSSLGIDAQRADAANPTGLMFGTPRTIRSDEFLTQTAMELNVLANGHSSHSPLAESGDLLFQVSSGQFFESVFFFDANILRLGPWLPDAMLFAGFRALPFLLLTLTLPPLLQRLGATRSLSWLALVLVIASPTALWWSFSPVRILAFASTGCYLLVKAVDHWRGPARGTAVAAVLAALAGICLGRLATSYVPWSVTVGLPLVIATALYLLASNRRTALPVLMIGALVGGTMLTLTVWDNIDAFRATLGTLYPGQRRSTGMVMEPFQLFGAPGLPLLQDGREPVILNSSEISSAFLICGLWAALLLLRPRQATPQRGHRAATAALGALTGLWALWCLLPWGALGTHIPLLNLVPPGRAVQTVGIPAALLLALVLSRQSRVPTKTAVMIGVFCAGVTAFGVADLRRALPAITNLQVLLISTIVGVVIVALSRYAHKTAVVSVVCAGLIASAVGVNPIIFGLGDLRSTPAANAAREIGANADREGVYVVADNEFVSGLMVANGVPTLTGWQFSGPNTAAWEEIDPDGKLENVWNRGASYLRMNFAGAPGSSPTIEAPTPDVLMLTVDPCSIPDDFDVGVIVSSAEINSPCLRMTRKFEYAGGQRLVYWINR